MPEIDLQGEHLRETAPEPAKPVTADLLLEIEEKQRQRFGGGRIGTGCVVLDEVFGGEENRRANGGGGGGLERGVVVGVSAEGREEEGVLISLNLIATILIPYLASPSTPKPKQPIAQIIDTTGSFPLALFANVLRSRLRSSHVRSHETGPETANYTVIVEKENSRSDGYEGDVEELVGQVLEMVAVTRVFDIEGLWEVLGEMNHPTSPKSHPIQQSSPDWESPIEKEINDSQADLSPSPPILENQPNKPEPAASHEEGIQILLIHILTPLLTSTISTRPKQEAHALITALSNNIHTFTIARNILTILHNHTVPTTLSSKFYQETGGGERKEKWETHLAHSVFSGGTVKPALGLVFDQFVGLNILVSSLPKSRNDAERLYGQDSNPYDSKDEIEYCLVIEILKDESTSKFGTREESWTAVNVDKHGTGFVAAFEERGYTRGMALSREKGVDLDGVTEERAGSGVGNVAKIYGFGGRRV